MNYTAFFTIVDAGRAEGYPLCCVIAFARDTVAGMEEIAVQRGCYQRCFVGYVHCPPCHKRATAKRRHEPLGLLPTA